MASEASSLPQQQQPAAAAGGRTGGSIGPFFAVMSVITVLAIISCVLGRMWTGNGTPLESAKHRGCLGWWGVMKRRRWRRRDMVGEVEVGAKVMAIDEDGNNNVKHGKDVQDQDPPQPQPQP